jgi:hypothetical protein
MGLTHTILGTAAQPSIREKKIYNLKQFTCIGGLKYMIQWMKNIAEKSYRQSWEARLQFSGV